MRNSKRSDSVAECQTIINEILEVKTFRFVEVQDFVGPGYTARQVIPKFYKIIIISAMFCYFESFGKLNFKI